MKKHHLVLAAVAAVALLAGTALAEKKAEKVKSGPQVGETLAGPFHPLNINGEKAGQKNCLYCAHGAKPVAMVFARQITPALTTLIKKIDAVNEKNKETMGSFVVFLGEQEGLEKDLKKLAEESGLKNTVLSIDNPAGPKGYNVSKDADITVVLYVDRTVKFNDACTKGNPLTEKCVEKIVAELPTILK